MHLACQQPRGGAIEVYEYSNYRVCPLTESTQFTATKKDACY
jgi:hypothetical protein